MYEGFRHADGACESESVPVVVEVVSMREFMKRVRKGKFWSKGL